ncbi:hypothetical protein EKO23_12785 [Nocardioides guangzhouensis]|uniref:Glycosyltransferase RgtA/B/C/D-like domain-containing protein n=1 Tax=Nocardioides guangzhouensis TaxID=2497878 RepID=A0A4Q4ZBQ5_9ACTN|nr:glycosyltransferase family 39 protein [Nocardioides guangzhouensis]RYP85352.1 hypothetical protein EKO23_12785 [Nocardioides guangzhouensis]
MPPDAERSARLRIDPLLLAVTVAALAVYLLHGWRGALSRDLAVYAYAGQMVADGNPPYVEMLNRAGPLAHLLPGLGAAAARVVGIDDLVGMRMLFLLLSVATVSALYVAARALFASRQVALASACTFLAFYGFIEYASNGPREKTPMVLFLVLMIWALARRRWLLAGVFLALATLSLQIAFFVGAPAALGALLLGLRKWDLLRGTARLAAGGLLTLAAFVAYFVAVGAVRDFVDAFVVINLRYTPAQPMSSAKLSFAWDNLLRGYGASVWLILVGLVAMVVVAALGARGWRRLPEDGPAATVVALGPAVLVGTLWTMRDFDGWPDAFPLLPFAALGIGGMLALTLHRLPVRAVLVTTLVWSLATTGLALGLSLDGRSDRLDVQRASVARTLRVLPDATMFSVQAPQPLVLAGRHNPSKYQMFSNGLLAYLDDTWPGGVDGYRAWILERQPDLIALGKTGGNAWRRALADDYQRVGCAPGWRWLARRSLGEETLARLAEANPCARGAGPAVDRAP